jgi:hypothetical protein
VKKLQAFILAIIYISFSIGATLNQHYCMGELVGTSLFDLHDAACGKCGMPKHTEASKDCCKDVSIVIKADDAHTFSQTVYDFQVLAFILPDACFIANSFTTPASQTVNAYRAHSPPLLQLPLFIQFGNFRI